MAVCDVPTEERWTCVFVLVFLQLDLEPEGKVYVHVSLTGSFIDGKAAATTWAAHNI